MTGRVTAIVVSFDEERIERSAAGSSSRSTRLVDPRLPPGVRAYYNGSLEISETYNRITLETSASSRRQSLRHGPRDLSRCSAPGGGRCLRIAAVGQRDLDAGPLRAAGLQLQRAQQHDRATDRRAGDRRRRAHHPALRRGAAPRRRRRTRSSRRWRTWPRRSSARAGRRRSGWRRSRRATSWRCGSSASGRRSA